MYIKYPDEYPNYQITWEMCKIEIKQRTIAFSKRKHKNQVDNLNILESRLQKLTESSSCNPDEVETLEKEIQQIYNERASGAQIRSRVTLIEENEKCSKYFVNLEKSRQSKGFEFTKGRW